MAKVFKIAIADDERTVREYFTAVLRKLGYDVILVAANGRELLEGCRLNRPDLLVTDIRMDELTGVEVMQELGKMGRMPTILISAHYRLEDLDVDLNGHVVAFLSKPVKLASLEAAVARAAESWKLPG